MLWVVNRIYLPTKKTTMVLLGMSCRHFLLATTLRQAGELGTVPVRQMETGSPGACAQGDLGRGTAETRTEPSDAVMNGGGSPPKFICCSPHPDVTAFGVLKEVIQEVIRMEP